MHQSADQMIEAEYTLHCNIVALQLPLSTFFIRATIVLPISDPLKNMEKLRCRSVSRKCAQQVFLAVAQRGHTAV